MRLALDVDLGCWAVDPDVEREVRAAAAALADAGAVVEEVDLGWTRELPDAWSEHWGVYLEAIFGHVVDEFRDRMDPRLLALMDAGRAMDAVSIQAPRVRPHRRLEAARDRCSSSTTRCCARR